MKDNTMTNNAVYFRHNGGEGIEMLLAGLANGRIAVFTVSELIHVRLLLEARDRMCFPMIWTSHN